MEMMKERVVLGGQGQWCGQVMESAMIAASRGARPTELSKRSLAPKRTASAKGLHGQETILKLFRTCRTFV
jgi:hypothetical protein